MDRCILSIAFFFTATASSSPELMEDLKPLSVGKYAISRSGSKLTITYDGSTVAKLEAAKLQQFPLLFKENIILCYNGNVECFTPNGTSRWSHTCDIVPVGFSGLRLAGNVVVESEGPRNLFGTSRMYHAEAQHLEFTAGLDVETGKVLWTRDDYLAGVPLAIDKSGKTICISISGGESIQLNEVSITGKLLRKWTHDEESLQKLDNLDDSVVHPFSVAETTPIRGGKKIVLLDGRSRKVFANLQFKGIWATIHAGNHIFRLKQPAS